jgi:hypothetical protein
MAFARSAKLGLILPVRTERDEPRRQLALLTAQYLLHRTRQVIVAKPTEDAIEILEGKFMRFQKSLLRRTWIRPMKGRTACHRTHLEDLQLDPFPIQIGIRFVLIDLHLDAPVVALRNE